MPGIFVFMQNRPHYGAQILHVNTLHALRQRLRTHRITIIGKYPASKLCQELGLADEWYDRGKGRLARKVLAERPEYIICLGRRSHLPIMLARLVGAKVVAYRDRYLSFLQSVSIDYDERVYRGINYERLLRSHGIEPLDYPADGENGGHDKIWFMPGGRGGNPGTLRGIKKWGVDRFYEVYLRLRADYPQYHYGFVFGPSESFDKQWLQTQPLVPEILVEPDIQTLFAQVKRARLVIANDCGPAHVSHTLRKDMVQLFFGPNPEWFLPRDGAIQLHGSNNDIATIQIDAVEASARQLLDRRSGGC